MGSDASLMDVRLDSVDSLLTAIRVHLAIILAMDEALGDLVTLALISLHLLSMDRKHGASSSDSFRG